MDAEIAPSTTAQVQQSTEQNVQSPTSLQAGQLPVRSRAALNVHQHSTCEAITHTAHLITAPPAQRVPDPAEASLNLVQSALVSHATTTHAQDVHLPFRSGLHSACSIPQLQQQQPVETLQQPAETVNAGTGHAETPAPAISTAAGICHHAETPMWLPAQLQQLRQHYRDAQFERAAHGMQPCVLMSQRVAFVVLEQFEQRDRAGAVDVLKAGLHVGQ